MAVWMFCSSSIVFKVLKRMENRQTLTVLVVDNRPRHEGLTPVYFTSSFLLQMECSGMCDRECCVWLMECSGMCDGECCVWPMERSGMCDGECCVWLMERSGMCDGECCVWLMERSGMCDRECCVWLWGSVRESVCVTGSFGEECCLWLTGSRTWSVICGWWDCGGECCVWLAGSVAGSIVCVCLSVPSNIQLWVYYALISIWRHRYEACASCRHTRIFSDWVNHMRVGREKQSSEIETPLASLDFYLQCWLVQQSLPKILFQCWLVQQSLPKILYQYWLVQQSLSKILFGCWVVKNLPPLPTK